MAYNNSDLDKSFKSIEVSGFNFKKEIMGYSWTKLHHDRIERIIIGYGGYPDSYRIYSPTVDISFEGIENTLNPLYEKYKIENRYGNTMVQRVLIGIKDVDYTKLQVEISNEESFNFVSQEVRKLIIIGALPFFEKFNTLQKVNEEICRLNEEEISSFISGIVGIKVPLIKKLTGANDFLKELKERKRFYSDEVFKYPQYFKDHNKVFNELFADDLKAV